MALPLSSFHFVLVLVFVARVPSCSCSCCSLLGDGGLVSEELSAWGEESAFARVTLAIERMDDFIYCARKLAPEQVANRSDQVAASASYSESERESAALF